MKKKIIFNVNKVNTELSSIDDEVVVFSDDGEYHYFKGKLHREDGPSVITDHYFIWKKNGLTHRNEEPAIERNEFFSYDNMRYPCSYDKPYMKEFRQIEYWKDDKLHRDIDPAIIITFYLDDKFYTFNYWYQNGILFRGENMNSVECYQEKQLIYYESTNNKGQYHRSDGKPAIWSSWNEIKEGYYLNGWEHRDGDLPSTVTKIMKQWKKNGMFYYRDNDQPNNIYFYDDGSIREEYVMKDGYSLHRLHGPARIICDSNSVVKSEEYYVNGKPISKMNFDWLSFFGTLKNYGKPKYC